MKSDEEKAPAQASPSDPEAAARRSYARQIDCGGPDPGQTGAPPHDEVENGRGTGRLRNPREDH